MYTPAAAPLAFALALAPSRLSASPRPLHLWLLSTPMYLCAYLPLTALIGTPAGGGVVLLPLAGHFALAHLLLRVLPPAGQPGRAAAGVALYLTLLSAPLLGLFALRAVPAVSWVEPMWLLGPLTCAYLALLAGVGRRGTLPLTLTAAGVCAFALAETRPVPSAQRVTVQAAQPLEHRDPSWLNTAASAGGVTLLPEQFVRDPLYADVDTPPGAAGVVYGATEIQPLHHYNATYLDGQVIHRKRALVPQTEDHLSPGPRSEVFTYRGVRYALLVCSEALLLSEAARLAREGAQVLLIPARNDMAVTAYQQAAVARAAAASVGLSAVMSNELGYSEITGPGVYQRLPWGQAGRLEAAVPLGHPSVYAQVQPLLDTGALLWLAALLLAAAVREFPQAESRHGAGGGAAAQTHPGTAR